MGGLTCKLRWCEIWSLLRAQFLLVVAIGAPIGLLCISTASAAEPKRVLVVHSFGSVAPPFTTHSTAFEAELVKQMGNHVDLDEVSLDMARYATPDMQEALVDYLEKRGAKWKPDLVVPIGGPAGVFVAKFRHRLFSKIPILYCSLDRRLLGPDDFDENTAFIGADYKVSGFVEDILQIAPETKNIAVVIGATPPEQYWAEAFRKGFEPFTNRVNFIWLNHLSFDQMLEQVKTLPPNSYIFLILFLRDAAGVTQNADEALQRLHEVANAPINSIFTSQMGLGIVGGRLYPSTEDGMKGAETAVRILKGEPPSSFPPRIVPPSAPQYDWRELQRWNIDERHLPLGSKILFRTPTFWEQNRWWMIAGASIVCLQGLLIIGLLANLVRRRRAEGFLLESEQRFQTAADAAPVLIWMAGTDKLCTFFNQGWLEFTGRTLEQECGNGWAEGVHAEDLDHCLAVYGEAFDAREPFTMEYRLRRKDGEYRWLLDNGTPRFDAGGAFVGYIGSCVDIADRKQAEVDHQVQSTELARVGRVALMGELAASLAHEVNNPLGAMVTNASAGKRLIAQGKIDSEVFRELLDDIVADGHRAREVIQGIRNMVRKSESSRSVVWINDTIHDLLRIVRADALSREVTVAADVEADAGHVMADRVQLLQVLLNLTMNAFEAMSVIRKNARRLTIRAGRDGSGEVLISVRDSGPGFPGGLVEQLFEPFFSTKVEGTGMGLAIAHSIIEAHGGTLSGENCDGGGARFTVRLPEAREDKSQAA